MSDSGRSNFNASVLITTYVIMFLTCRICSQLAETYGNVYSLRMGQTWMVVVNSFKVVREALVTHGESVSDRPHQPLQEEIGSGKGEGGLTRTKILCSFTAANNLQHVTH